MITLTDFDLEENLTPPWWVSVTSTDPGILTIKNIVTDHQALYEIGEVHETPLELLAAINDAYSRFISNPPDPALEAQPFPLLAQFQDVNGVSLRFDKKTASFYTISDSGIVLRRYSLIDLFLNGPDLIKEDAEALDFMLKQGLI